MSRESKKIWNYEEKGSENQYPDKYAQIAPLLDKRGIEPDQLDEFFSPNISKYIMPEKLYGAKTAAKEILSAAKKGKKIVIHGDFDADGICATSILWEFLYIELAALLDVKVDVVPYIPSRVDEGYGLSEASIDAMKELGAQLIITVDCGIRDAELIEKHSSKKLSFIVTDHHQPPENIVEVSEYTIVHQDFPDNAYPYTNICGAAVVFILIQAIKKEAGVKENITNQSKGLDLVALATVTDMMKLKEINRAFVIAGLSQMRMGTRKGLVKLFQNAQVDLNSIDSYHLGFVIGPRINAAGRIGTATDALRLLLSQDDGVIEKYVNILESLNRKRQNMTEELISKALGQIKQQPNQLLNFVVGEKWAEGIVGLVAGKVQEYTGRPTIVVTQNNGETRGSARSLPGLNITDAIEKYNEHLIKYGGHEQAAGFSVKEGELESFRTKLQQYVNENVDEKDLVQKIDVDLHLTAEQLKIALVESLDLLKPFGYGNSKPQIMITSAVIVEMLVMGAGKNHLKIKFKDNGMGLGIGVMFDCKDDIQKLKIDDKIDILGSVQINSWNGNVDVQFMINEWRYSL